MASDMPSMPSNGNYAPHSGYGSLESGQNGYHSTSEVPQSNHSTNTSATAPTQASNSGTKDEVPKDEVGWYFVEQYYTTLSRSPEKLTVSWTSDSTPYKASANVRTEFLQQAFPIRLRSGN